MQSEDTPSGGNALAELLSMTAADMAAAGGGTYDDLRALAVGIGVALLEEMRQQPTQADALLRGLSLLAGMCSPAWIEEVARRPMDELPRGPRAILRHLAGGPLPPLSPSVPAAEEAGAWVDLNLSDTGEGAHGAELLALALAPETVRLCPESRALVARVAGRHVALAALLGVHPVRSTIGPDAACSALYRDALHQVARDPGLRAVVERRAATAADEGRPLEGPTLRTALALVDLLHGGEPK